MPRKFNTTGPCRPGRHYMLPPLDRLPNVQELFDDEEYFVIHAPRQTGKTTAMRALAEALREKGQAACWVTLEASRRVEEVAAAEPLWLRALHRASRDLPDAWRAPNPAPFLTEPVGGRLGDYVGAWAERLDVPLVLLLDEADSVSGPAMISLLSQLREGFMDRGVGAFPTSIALVGMRDLRDYLAASKDGVPVNAGSPFNVSAGSFTLRNFNADEVTTLLAQHTDETGQPFEPEAAAELHRLTDGQPFLVNALADLCVTQLMPERAVPITPADVDAAREQLILARRTHLDNLAERLKEPRVARIVEAALLGDDPRRIAYDSDEFQYVIDLGLLKLGRLGAEAANPIYREVLVRQLTYNLQLSLPQPWSSPRVLR